ncbi:hypothetical protein H6P81_000545 [Aristolochia fimbriata]|uniref:Transmembrane protein n=1 Tax=Aristolochia fimbriata TaxID=158543 RepID=A0AAV7F4J9_ARIFI|nr:hypothetical protein H6P81_000545 [Aristolochia fimbriata]
MGETRRVYAGTQVSLYQPASLHCSDYSELKLLSFSLKSLVPEPAAMELASVDSTKKRSCFSSAKILKEALVLISRNVKLFSAIALLVFIPSSLLFLVTQLAIKPQASQILAEVTESSITDTDYSRQLLPHLIKSLVFLLSEELLIVALSWFLSVFSMTATIYASAVTYSGNNHLSLRELLASIGRPWKRAAVTYLNVTLLNIGFIILYALALILVTARGSLVFTLLGISILVATFVFHLFMTAVWTLSVAVSVLEEGWYGMRALKKAWDLIRGRRIQAFRLSSLATLAMLPVIGWQVGNNGGESLLLLILRSVLLDGVSVLLQILVYVAYTVFYHECKTSQGEKVSPEGKPHYSLIPTSPSP